MSAPLAFVKGMFLIINLGRYLLKVSKHYSRAIQRSDLPISVSHEIVSTRTLQTFALATVTVVPGYVQTLYRRDVQELKKTTPFCSVVQGTRLHTFAIAWCIYKISCAWMLTPHYSDVIMSAMKSQITGVSSVCSTVCWGADQTKLLRSASLAGGFPSHEASNAENVSVWWRHHVMAQTRELHFIR